MTGKTIQEFDLVEGQVYTCVETASPYFKEGEDYNIVVCDDTDIQLGIDDRDGGVLSATISKFVLKDDTSLVKFGDLPPVEQVKMLKMHIDNPDLQWQCSFFGEIWNDTEKPEFDDDRCYRVKPPEIRNITEQVMIHDEFKKITYTTIDGLVQNDSVVISDLE